MMRRLGFRQSWVEVSFLASVGAAAIHFAAARPHFEEWAPAGGFMLASGLAQLGWALWVARAPGAVAIGAGVGLNAGIVATWLISRTAGLPFGPNPWMPEEIHIADAVATALEVGLIASTLAIASERRPHRIATVLAGIGAAAAVISPAHEPLREGVTAAAVLITALVARSLVVSVEVRREHVVSSIIRRVRGLLAAPDRADLGAGGTGARPRHRHLEQPGV